MPNTTLTTARRLVLNCGRHYDGVWRDRYLHLSRHIVFCQKIPQPAGTDCNCGRWHYSIWRNHNFLISWHVINRSAIVADNTTTLNAITIQGLLGTYLIAVFVFRPRPGLIRGFFYTNNTLCCKQKFIFFHF